MNVKKTIEEAVVFNCKKLSLPKPTVNYEPPTEFSTPTTKAGVDPRKLNTIGINTSTKWESSMEIWWVISHEMRHLWQVQTNYCELVKQDYSNLQDYAKRPEEVDANAWGIYITAIKFRSRPLLENVYGQEVWNLIAMRFNEIINEQQKGKKL